MAAKKTRAPQTSPELALAKKKLMKKKAIASPPTVAVKGKSAASGESSVEAAPGPNLVGKKAPAFKLLDQNGATLSSSSLAKRPYVLYFYPKDNTPGCTVEACDFRDGMANFRAAGVTIIGVSPDSPKSHAGFASKYELPFTLLSDPDKELAQAYGVWALKKNYGKEYWGIVRSTFLVGADGKVKAEWRGVRVKGHVQAVWEAGQV
jgi:thioredoxin-dependent peroxiredoxin